MFCTKQCIVVIWKDFDANWVQQVKNVGWTSQILRLIDKEFNLISAQKSCVIRPTHLSAYYLRMCKELVLVIDLNFNQLMKIFSWTENIVIYRRASEWILLVLGGKYKITGYFFISFHLKIYSSPFKTSKWASRVISNRSCLWSN